jgi:hypothetical protein
MGGIWSQAYSVGARHFSAVLGFVFYFSSFGGSDTEAAFAGSQARREGESKANRRLNHRPQSGQVRLRLSTEWLQSPTDCYRF